MHELKIKNDRVFLDDVEVKHVKNYELRASAESRLAHELTLTVLVSDVEFSYEKELPKNAFDLAPVVYELIDVIAKHKIPLRALDKVLEFVRTDIASSTQIQPVWPNDVYTGKTQ